MLRILSSLILIASFIGLRETAGAQQISGAGASFPAPIYARWGRAAQQTLGIALTYQAIGSNAGQDAVIARRVDFGATDTPLSPEKLAENHLLQFPTVLGAVVLIVNLPRVREGEFKLTGETLADIFAGKIRKWNDPRLAAINADITLPNLSITPIHRFEASGTTAVFSAYLTAVSAAWKTDIGAGTVVDWPVGPGARGNDGVATTVAITRGGIGYVESAFAVENHLTTARLRNKSGVFVKPDAASFSAAAQTADWTAPHFTVDLIDTAGAANWPILTATFVLIPQRMGDLTANAAVMQFFDWAFRNGQADAEALGYLAIPTAVQDAIRAAWRPRG